MTRIGKGAHPGPFEHDDCGLDRPREGRAEHNVGRRREAHQRLPRTPDEAVTRVRQALRAVLVGNRAGNGRAEGTKQASSGVATLLSSITIIYLKEKSTTSQYTVRFDDMV